MMREDKGSINGARGARREHDLAREANGIGSNEGREDDGDVNEDDLGAGRASYGDDLDTLDRRRTEELKLIGEYDS